MGFGLGCCFRLVVRFEALEAVVLVPVSVLVLSGSSATGAAGCWGVEAAVVALLGGTT